MVKHLPGRLKALAGLQEIAPADIDTQDIRRTRPAQRNKAQRINANA